MGRGAPGSLVGNLLVLPEITTFAGPVALIAAGIALAALASALTNRVPVPPPVIFLVAAAVVSDVVPALYDEVPILTVERVAVVALIVILLNGGMDIGGSQLRRSLGDVTAVGIAGTFATAAGVALTAHLVLGLDWKVSGVLGAALAPTDPAVMFSVLGRREIGGRSGTVLEGEAGINDPAGIALLLGMVEVATHDDKSVLVVAETFGLAMGIGLAAGLIGGYLLVRLVQRVPLPSRGQYPVLVLSSAGLIYGATSLVDGSGFLAVFVAGLMLSDAEVPYRADVERFVGGLANLAEVGVFLALGLTIQLSDIPTEDWLGGLAIFLVLAVLIRPLVVAVTLARSRLAGNEKRFIAFGGLKGAVPILLAAFAILGEVPDSFRIYNLVFVGVLLSVAVQGTLVPFVAARLSIPITTHAALPWELSVQLAEQPAEHLELLVEEGSWAQGRTLGELPLEPAAWVTVVIRDDAAQPARPDTRLESGDLVLVLGSAPEDVLERRFSGSAGGR